MLNGSVFKVIEHSKPLKDMDGEGEWPAKKSGWELRSVSRKC